MTQTSGVKIGRFYLFETQQQMLNMAYRAFFHCDSENLAYEFRYLVPIRNRPAQLVFDLKHFSHRKWLVEITLEEKGVGSNKYLEIEQIKILDPTDFTDYQPPALVVQ